MKKIFLIWVLFLWCMALVWCVDIKDWPWMENEVSNNEWFVVAEWYCEEEWWEVEMWEEWWENQPVCFYGEDGSYCYLEDLYEGECGKWELYYFEDDQLNVSNRISPDDLDFFEEYYCEYYSEIVYYEYDRPLCPKCGSSMNSNGSRVAKPNKWDGIRKKQYVCPECSKTQVTSLEEHIQRYSNYTRAICQKSLEYESICYLPYQKKA